MLRVVISAIVVAIPSVAGLVAFPSSAASNIAVAPNEILTDEQEALFGCGPYWGTGCELEGIDFTALESSVLLRFFPGLGGAGESPPLVGPPVFHDEMPALSWNFLMLLVATSAPLAGEPLGDAHFDPDDPYGADGPRCSFATPQYCSSVRDFLSLPEPGGGWLGAATCLAIARLRRNSRRA